MPFAIETKVAPPLRHEVETNYRLCRKSWHHGGATGKRCLTARDLAAETEWEFHNVITEAKTQVAAQFGPDSNEIQSLGRKKKSERARPTRRSSGDRGSTQ